MGDAALVAAAVALLGALIALAFLPARARVTFTANMRAVGWVAIRGPNRGKATMYVDGVAVATVDLYATSVQPPRGADWTTATRNDLAVGGALMAAGLVGVGIVMVLTVRELRRSARPGSDR